MAALTMCDKKYEGYGTMPWYSCSLCERFKEKHAELACAKCCPPLLRTDNNLKLYCRKHAFTCARCDTTICLKCNGWIVGALGPDQTCWLCTYFVETQPDG